MTRSKLWVVLVISIFLVVTYVSGAKILGIIPTASYSHQIPFRALWKELSLRGHEVTVITTDPVRDSSLTNLTEIDLSYAYKIMKKHKYNEKVLEFGSDMAKMFEFWTALADDVDEYTFNLPEIQNLMQNESVHYDIILMEYLNPMFFPFVHKFKAPYIAMTTFDVPLTGHLCLGNPNHPIVSPDLFLPYIGKLSFVERVISTGFNIYMQTLLDSILETTDVKVKKYFGDGYPLLTEIRCDFELFFVNSNPIFNLVRPVVPATVSIGGMHIQDAKELPSDLQEFLDSGKDGVIYFSLGTNVLGRLIPDTMKKTIMEAFSELPFKILWKFESDDLPGKPENVKIAKWLPQQDVLRHPNVKLFITQAGIQSVEESVFAHVPMLAIPFFADQQNNANRLVYKGLGLALDKDNLEKETLKKTILEVINNPKYKDKVTEIAELLLDEPMTGLEKAVWWTEYVLRNKGAKHLKGPAANIPSYQYYLLDVIGFLLAVLLICLFVIYKFLKFIVKWVKYLCKLKCTKPKKD